MNKDFLIHLGYVFYAISKADDNLSFEEYVKLSESLQKRWPILGKLNKMS